MRSPSHVPICVVQVQVEGIQGRRCRLQYTVTEHAAWRWQLRNTQLAAAVRGAQGAGETVSYATQHLKQGQSKDMCKQQVNAAVEHVSIKRGKAYHENSA